MLLVRTLSKTDANVTLNLGVSCFRRCRCLREWRTGRRSGRSVSVTQDGISGATTHCVVSPRPRLGVITFVLRTCQGFLVVLDSPENIIDNLGSESGLYRAP